MLDGDIVKPKVELELLPEAGHATTRVSFFTCFEKRVSTTGTECMQRHKYYLSADATGDIFAITW
jgi:hypothetical protein